MRRIAAGIIIAMIGCVSIPAWVDAQPRDEGRGRARGRGIAEQDMRGQRRSYRGRQQRRRWYGGRYEWYEEPAVGAAIGSFFGSLFRRNEPEEVEEQEPPGEASME